jgi:dolichol-phosphate mannosyltransferase
MPSLAVICPVFEEGAAIRIFHEALREELVRLKQGYESKVIYVCDPGRDDTEDHLRALAAADSSTIAIILSRRFGHQASLLAGIDHADADVLIMMDADMQHPPAIIPKLLARYEEGFDIVHTIRVYGTDVGWIKNLTSRLYYKILRSLSEIDIRESAADFRLISRRVAVLFQKSIRERNQFMRGLFSWVGFKQSEVSFLSAARSAGVTKYSTSRMIRFAVAGVTSFSKKPLRYSVYLGLSIAALGLLLAAVTIAQWLGGADFPAGWTTLTALIAVLGGAQLIFLGVLGEYIASIFDEVKARPLYIVDQIVHL